MELLPIADAIAERRTMRGLQVLDDLIGVQKKIPGQGDCRPNRERQRQNQGKKTPNRLARPSSTAALGPEARQTFRIWFGGCKMNPRGGHDYGKASELPLHSGMELVE